MTSADERIDTDRPSTARVYDYLMGGKDNYLVDRVFANRLAERCPNVNFPVEVRDNRAFMVRAVQYLAGEVGLQQFLDIGTGLPTQANVHEVAQGIDAEARVVYVDKDPVVLAHARALLTGTPQGATAYIDADLRHPESILDAAARTLDFEQPVALNFIAVLHFVPNPEPVVAAFREAMAPGSHLVITHAEYRDGYKAVAEEYQRAMGVGALRSAEQIRGLFGDWAMLAPGLVPVAAWRPEAPALAYPPARGLFVGGVARKPGGPS